MSTTSAYLKTISLALLSVTLVISVISYPKEVYEASLKGLSIWWEVVFPALLPFFITAELMIGFGVVHFLGILLEPFMRPFFRVPGTGGFVMAMGLSSGYPMGAKLTVRLREEGLITRTEGERLVSTTTTSGPLFMLGAVAVGFFNDVRLGVIIALAHYTAAICVGFLMRFHEYHGEMSKQRQRSGNIFYRALQAMHRARIEDNRTIGILMGDAVMSSIQTQLMVGGFIIIFSVLLSILDLIGIQLLLNSMFSFLLLFFGLSAELSPPLISGIFEITLGSQLASEVSDRVPLVAKVATAGAIIAWSGLSVHAQVASMLAKTDIRYTPYLCSRILHAILSAVITFLIWKPMENLLFQTDAAFIQINMEYKQQTWDKYTYFSFTLLFLVLLITTVYLLIRWAKWRAKA